MKIKVFNTSEYLRMPWKNKQGYTLQLASSHSSLENFDWRISIAYVNQNSVFSKFENKYRLISLLEGKGFILDNQLTQDKVNLKKNEIYHFSGDAFIASELIDSPIRDFNLIYNPTLFNAAMNYHSKDLNISVNGDLKIIVIFNADKSDLIIKVNQTHFCLKEYELLKVENDDLSQIDFQISRDSLSYFIIQLQSMY